MSFKKGNLKKDRHTGRKTYEDKGRDLQAKKCQRLPGNDEKLQGRPGTGLSYSA